MRTIVSGIGAVSAIGDNVAQNTESLKLLRSGIGELTVLHTCHAVPCGEVKHTNPELAEMAGLKPGTYSRTALLGMIAAKEAADNANLDTATQRVGLISATSVGGMDLTENYFEAEHNGKRGRLRQLIEHDCGASTERIAAHLGIKHFMTTISTACSSSANAIMLGHRMIQHGLLDAVVVGGTDSLCKFTINGFSSLQILDSNLCRPFDKSRAGLNLGEGAGYLVLQREEDVCCSKHAAILGCANANDAHHQTATSETGDGPFLAMTKALKMAGLGNVDYINVHGTGTQNNDRSEYAAIKRIWGNNIPPYSSTKLFTGHTLAACGALEAIFCIQMMHNRTIYPTFNFKNGEDADFVSPVTVTTKAEHLNAVMSNSFGFGGNMTSIILGKL